MKKYLILFIPLAMLTACQDYKAEIEKLKSEKEMLVESASYRDSTINSFLQSFNEIEANLEEISQRQADISDQSGPGELKKSQVDRIRENIAAINTLMKDNKDKLAQLSKQLKSSNFKLKELEKMLASYNEQLEEKNQQLALVNEELSKMKVQVESLNTQLVVLNDDNLLKQSTIETQVKELNKAFVVTGTSKQLEEQQVIVRTGGFLGIGKEEKLNSDINRGAFNAIDITQTNVIPLEAKDVELLTYHPEDSYDIKYNGKEADELVITDPKKFWEGSRYLVVMIDK